jgi:hypothetical protein
VVPVARIPTLSEDDPATPAEARDFLLSTRDNVTGEIFNSMRLLANHPTQARKLTELIRSLRRDGGLTRIQTELAWTTSALVNGCHY